MKLGFSYLLFVCFLLSLACKEKSQKSLIIGNVKSSNTENEKYENPSARDSLEFLKMVDPQLGYVPYSRLEQAIEQTVRMKKNSSSRIQSFNWEERGPIYDSVGPSNINGRGGGTGFTASYTGGRIRAILVDTLNDPSGNTVFAGSVSGGLWRCTNFLSAIPNWQPINDALDNLAIASICQNPSNPSIMYFSTGEATSNFDFAYGKGVWKSVNAGLTWTYLPSTSAYSRSFKIICDASGNVYLALRTTTYPVLQFSGLFRSTNGGTSWTDITPNAAMNNADCQDIEISNNGRLHACFAFGTKKYAYTDNPSTVTQANWNYGIGIRSTPFISTSRMELAVHENIVYAISATSDTNEVDSCYRSSDGGQTWTIQNPSGYFDRIAAPQGWYNLALSINPTNTNEIIIAGIDAFISTNQGTTLSQLTYWVTSSPYVHADHHFIFWWRKNNESRIIIGCDGGVFYSNNKGITWIDKNRNLAIKQFYSCALHPNAGSNYLLAGSQDNGVHQLQYPGKSYSFEVTGGDGGFVHINQLNPSLQFGSYVYNNYRRSTDGGLTWSHVDFSFNGLFINPYDYDNSKNILYASNGGVSILRWLNANTSAVAEAINFSAFSFGTVSAIKVSPHTSNRLFLGGIGGGLIRMDNADTLTSTYANSSITEINGDIFYSGFVNCIEVGTNDNVLVMVMTNYGINNVWYTTNGGTNWLPIDGNLPDMPVRWAVFEPGSNNRIIIATEAGVYSTEQVNGTNTVWTPHAGFPTVRTTMLKIRPSDRTIVASTYGRGLWTGTIPYPTAIDNVNNTKNFIRYVSGENKQIFIATGTLSTRRINLQLFDLSGRMIYLNSTSYQNTFIRNAKLIPGVYILKIEGDKKEYFVQKIVVR